METRQLIKKREVGEAISANVEAGAKSSAVTPVVGRGTKKLLNSSRKSYFRSTRFFQFSIGDLARGIGHFRDQVKKQYRHQAHLIHPDKKIQRGTPGNSINGSGFRLLKADYNHFMSLNSIPHNFNNFDTLFEITKGYKTTEDYPEIFS